MATMVVVVVVSTGQRGAGELLSPFTCVFACWFIGRLAKFALVLAT